MKDIEKINYEDMMNHGYKEDGSFILDETWGMPDFSKDISKSTKKDKINEK